MTEKDMTTITGLRVHMVSSSFSDAEDLPDEPGILLCGSTDAVKAAAALFGEDVLVSVSSDLVPALLARAEAAEAEVARLREVYWRIRGYVSHDDGCKLNKAPRFSGPCSCGLADALKGGAA